MKTKITSVAIAAALAGLATAVVFPIAAQASPIIECGTYNPGYTRVVGSPAGIINLTTRGVRCLPARAFALKVTARMSYRMSGMRFQNDNCRFVPFNRGHEVDVRCVKSPNVIHWQIGD